MTTDPRPEARPSADIAAVDATPPVPSLTPLRRAWRSANQTIGFIAQERDRELHIASQGGASVVLSLADVPDGVAIVFTNQSSTVSLSDLAAGQTVTIRAAGEHDLTFHLRDSVRGRVVIARGDDPATPGLRLCVVEAAEAPDASLVVRGSAVTIAQHFQGHVDLEDGFLTLSANVRYIALHGKTRIHGGHRARVDVIKVHGETECHWTSPSTLIVQEMRGTTGSVLRVQSDQDRQALKVRHLHSLTVEARKQFVIGGIQSAADLILNGPVRLDLGPSADAQRLTGAELNHAVPTLTAGTSAFLTDLTGEFDLGSVSGAHLDGGSAGFTIRSLLASDGAPSTNVEKAVLRGFHVPGGLTGRVLLSNLSGAFHLDPATARLPGVDPAFKVTHAVRSGDLGAALLGSAPATLNAASLHQDAELLRELRRLANTKGAPGSTRSVVGWCSYRLRHATTTGLPERLALTGYRALGYGERPGPAMLTWLAISLLAAVLTLADNGLDPTPGGLWTLAEETLTQAFGPLAAIMRSGTATLDEAWQYVMRAFIAVPLVTAALAFRNYVKNGSDAD